MKFYCAEGPAVARFDRECAIYERFQEPYLKAEADNYLPRILDVYQSDSAVTGSAGDALPPCLVEEQGAYSLQVGFLKKLAFVQSQVVWPGWEGPGLMNVVAVPMRTEK